ncbi:MAG TPA: HAMP domain-containing sensor histidine kinase [Caulobacterales bacterium]|nr:HAMP domain-containing sensor histidine kinase [Caulobacterales bacterium]
MRATAKSARILAAVTESPEAAVSALWVIASIMLGVVAARTGVSQLIAASAVGLAIIPAAATLALRAAPGWRGPWTSFAWTGFACAASAATGGFASPMAAAFALAPALAARGSPSAEAAFFALLGYGVAGLAALTGPEPVAAGVLPALGAGMSIIGAGALMAAGKRGTIITIAPATLSPEAPPPATDAAAAGRRRLAELSHELRTPLTHIIGFADVMRQQLFGPLHEKYAEYIELIHQSGQNLLELVNRLLDLSRIEAGKFDLRREEFDIALLADEVFRLTEQSASNKNIVLTLEPVTLPLQVNADAAAMRQILINLVANAIKFTPEGGRVTIRAYAHDGKLRLEVQDNGPGIPAAERARLGAAFERGASGASAEGYGIGLSLVRAFAELHGGTLSFHDAPGGGALVRVEMAVFA